MVRLVFVLAAAALSSAALAAPASAAAPANDDFADARTITGVSGGVVEDIDLWEIDATREAGEPLHAGTDDGSRWYQWVAPSSVVMMFDTIGSTDPFFAGYDGSALAVYVGTSLSELTNVAYDAE